MNDSWKVLSSVRIPNGLDDELVWEEGGKQAYKELMGKYLSPPQWKVRFAMFEGDVSKRAEEYRVYITGNGKVARVWHKVPETKSGSSLSRGEARKIADSVLLRMYQLKPSSLKEISVEPSKQPARVDWVFTFAAPHHYSLNGGEPRIGIEIAGDEVVDAYRYIYVPRSWSREERSRGNPIDVIEDFFSSIKLFVLVAGMVAGIVCWSRRKFSVAAFFAFFLLLLGQELISLINGWPDIKAAFSTAEPLANQMLAEVSSSLTTSVLVSGALALIAGFVQRWKRPQAEIKPCRALWLGLAMGTAIAGLSSFLRHLAPSLAPNWADYEAAGHSLPILETALAPVADYIKLTIFLLLVIVAVDRLSKRGSAWKYIFTVAILSVRVSVPFGNYPFHGGGDLHFQFSKRDYVQCLPWGDTRGCVGHHSDLSFFLLLVWHLV